MEDVLREGERKGTLEGRQEGEAKRNQAKRNQLYKEFGIQ